MPQQNALIINSHGNQGTCELDTGSQVSCLYRRSVGRPVCGDQVRVESGQASGFSVEKICERKNQFFRGLRDGGKQLMAANLDQVIIVIAPQPAPSRDLLDRYLVAVLSLGIEPVIVVNKCELLPADSDQWPEPFNRMGDYPELLHPVIFTSCKGAPGIEALIPVLRDRTSILVGQSGVGKSSLVNQLVPDLELQTQTLSQSTGKGRHTTTTTMMFRLPGAGRLIDSPGVWEYGLWDMDQDELIRGFPDLAPFHGKCRFNNCRHLSEPGCEVAAAAEQGKIKSSRLESYRRLLEQGEAFWGR